jgi:hypothetical protein
MFYRKFVYRTLLALLAALVMTGCGKKPKPVVVSTEVLEGGKGALLIVFPEPLDYRAEGWGALAALDGPGDTRQLPRVPFADLHAIMVLNVVPGNYRVNAQNWMRGGNPENYTTRDSISVRAGELLKLEGRRATAMLEVNGSTIWQLETPRQLRDYIAGTVSKTSRQ